MSKQKLRIIAIFLVFAIVLTGCTQKAPVEPTPAPTPNPTVAPTPEQTPEPTPTPKPTKRPGGGGGSSLGNHQHTFSDWVVVEQANCEKKGLKRRICNLCQIEEFQTIPALEHNYKKVTVAEDVMCNEDTYRCDICNSEHYVKRNVEKIEAKVEESILDCKEDFSFIVSCKESDPIDYITNNLTIIDSYFVKETDVPNAKVLFNVTSIGNNKYKISPQKLYEKGTTYTVNVTDKIEFDEEKSPTLTFNVIKEQTGEYKFDPKIKFVNSQINEPIALGEKYNNERDIVDSVFIDVTNIDGLEINDVICVGVAQNPEEINETSVIGKIKAITQKDEMTFTIELIAPEINEVYEDLDIYCEQAIDLENNVNDLNSVSEKIVDALYQDDEFATFLATTHYTSNNYIDDHNLYVEDRSMKSFLDKVKIDCKVSINGMVLSAKINGSIVVPLTTKDNIKIGELSLSFLIKEDVSFKVLVNYKLKKTWWIPTGIETFDLRLSQNDKFNFNFDVKFNLSYKDTDDLYIINENSKKIHEMNCRYVDTALPENIRATKQEAYEFIKKGYNVCKLCKPIEKLNRDSYVLNTETKKYHCINCYHVKNMKDSHMLFSELPITQIEAAGYSSCDYCTPNVLDEDEFQKDLMKNWNEKDWAKSVEEIKDLSKSAGCNKESTAGIELCNLSFSIYHVVVIRLKIDFVLKFSIDASINYQYECENLNEYGIRLDSKGITPYTSKTSKLNADEFTMMGEINFKIGIGADLGMRLLGLSFIQAGIVANAGVYIDAGGIVRLSGTDPQQNYSAAYLESGLFFDASAYYRLFSLKGEVLLLSGKVMLVKLGYDKAVYGYENLIDEINIDEDCDLNILGLYDVRLFDLSTMSLSNSKLLPNGNDKYKINYNFESGEYLTVDNGIIKIAPDAPFEFKDKLTVVIRSDSTWKDFEKDSCVYYLEPIEIEINAKIPCVDHKFVEIERIEPTCMNVGKVIHKCERCSESKETELAKVNHDYTIISTNGNSTHNLNCKFKSCGKSITVPCEYGAITEILSPTCTTEGISQKQCSKCNHIIKENIKRLEHNYVNGVCTNCNDNINLTIKFESNGGNLIDDIVLVKGKCIESELKSVRKGYTFCGWFDNSNCLGDRIVFPYKPTGNTTLYAKWTLISYSITYVLNGGINNKLNPDTYTIADTVKLLNASKEGEVFLGWFDSAVGGQNVTEFFTSRCEDVKLYARWVNAKQTITYHMNGGRYIYGMDSNNNLLISEDQIINIALSQDMLPFEFALPIGKNPSYENTIFYSGMYFEGWFDNEMFNGDPITRQTTFRSVQLFAKWTEHEYEVKYNLDGGTNHVNNPTKYKVSDRTVFLENPTKSGYHFVGWKIKRDYDDESRFDGIINSISDVYSGENQAPIVRTAIWSKTDQNTLEDQVPVNFTVNAQKGKVGVYRRESSGYGDHAKITDGEKAYYVNVYAIPDPGYRVVIAEDDTKPTYLKLGIDDRNDILNGDAMVYSKRFEGVTISFELIPNNLPVITTVNFYSDEDLTIPVANMSKRPMYQSTYLDATYKNGQKTDLFDYYYIINENENTWYSTNTRRIEGEKVGDKYTIWPKAILGYSTVDPKFEELENRPYIVISAAEKATLTFITTEGTMSAGAGETYRFSADKKTAVLETFVGKSAKAPILTKPGYDVWWHDENGNSISRLTESGRGYIREVVGSATYTATFVEDSTSIPGFRMSLFKNDTALVVEYNGSDPNVTIPSEYRGRPVVRINCDAFKDNKTIKSVVIPDSVITIEQNAFSGCSNLETVKMSKNIEDVRYSAFTGTKAIKTVDGVSYVGTNGVNFDGAVVVGYADITSGATELTIKEGARVVADVEIENPNPCATIKTVNLPSTLYAIGRESLPQSITGVTIPATNNLTHIKDLNAKHKIVENSNVNGVVYVGNVALGLRNHPDGQDVTFKDTTITIEGYAIPIPDSQTSLTIPASVQYLKLGSFLGGHNVTEINFGEGSQLKEMEYESFIEFGKVKTIALPKFVCDVQGAFADMNGLETITVAEGNRYLESYDGVLYSKDGQLICYPSNKTGTDYTIRDKTTYIDSNAFTGVRNLTKLTIPSSVNYIFGKGFGSSSIQQFILSGTNKTFATLENGALLKDISSNTIVAFAGGSSLKDVVIPEGIVSIESNAFSSSKIESVKFPSSLKEIGLQAFEFCESLKKVKFADNGNLESISGFAFARTSLNSLDLPNTLKSIGDYAFAWLSDKSTLSGVIIPSSVTTIGRKAFYQHYLNALTIYVSWAENNKPAGWHANWAGNGNTIVYDFTNTAVETTFNVNGVGIIAPAKVVGVIANAPNVSLAGKTITWHTDSACATEAVTFPYAPTASGTLYAKATPNP